MSVLGGMILTKVVGTVLDKVTEPIANVILGPVVGKTLVEVEKKQVAPTGELEVTKTDVTKTVRAAPPAKGYRTILLNLVVFMLPALLTWIAGYSWEDYVSPQTAAIIVGAANLAMKFVTVFSGR